MAALALLAALQLLVGAGLLVRVVARAGPRAMTSPVACTAAATIAAGGVELVLASAAAPIPPLGLAVAITLGLLSLLAALALVLGPSRAAGPARNAGPDGAAPEEGRQALIECAVRSAGITVFCQDRDGRFRWILNSAFERDTSTVAGATEEQLFGPETARKLAAHRQAMLETQRSDTYELEIPTGDDARWFRVTVTPVRAGRDGEPGEVVSTAIEITRAKRFDRMRTDLSKRLAETLQRFNLALRSSNILVFSQDVNLRYTWSNSDDCLVGAVIGRTDYEFLPDPDREAMIALKTEVIGSRSARSAEIGVGSGSQRRWYDLHIEPNLAANGDVVGVTCAAVDISHRKRNEEQMRLVMRELTHRTKNLLAVAIAIARQTATRADRVDEYANALIARLRALAAAQDLIVAEDWGSVDLEQLIESQVGTFVPLADTRLNLDGPSVSLTPEASQNFALAIHELAANAARHGALSSAEGRVDVVWALAPGPDGDVLQLTWRERGGPAVSLPKQRGFGISVIERNLSRSLSAEVDLTFAESGLEARFSIPLKAISSVDRVPPGTPRLH